MEEKNHLVHCSVHDVLALIGAMNVLVAWPDAPSVQKEFFDAHGHRQDVAMIRTVTLLVGVVGIDHVKSKTFLEGIARDLAI